jgi:hypothetical protein
MVMVRDFKGRLYQILEVGRDTTLLRCQHTGDMVRVRSYGWDDIGFVRG